MKNILDPPIAGRFIGKGSEAQREQELTMADAAPPQTAASEIDIGIGGMACGFPGA
jgi:hypothetical protein